MPDRGGYLRPSEKADRVGEGDAVKKAEKDMAEVKALVTHIKCGNPYDH
jgi:hypothetical protein